MHQLKNHWKLHAVLTQFPPICDGNRLQQIVLHSVFPQEIFVLYLNQETFYEQFSSAVCKEVGMVMYCMEDIYSLS